MDPKTQRILIWVAVIIGVVIVVWLLSSFVMILLMKKAQKKAFKALDDLVPEEKKRFLKIKEFADLLVKEKRLKRGNILDAVHEQEVLFSGERIDMAKAKATNDFLVLYFRKYMKEKRLKDKDPYKDYYELFQNDIHIDPDDKKNPYRSYNKIAMRYNSYLNMTLVRSYANRKHYPGAPIL